MKPVKILLILLIAILLSEVNSVTIFEGLSIKKGIDISFIPFPIKPIAFIKEKWTPFGSFGIKHGIARRQVINIIEPEIVVTPVPVIPPAYVIPEVPRPEHVPVAPVVEHHDETEIPKENVEIVSEIPLLTPPEAPVLENKVSESSPIVAAIEEPVVPSETVLATPVEVPPVLITPVPSIPIAPAPPIPIQAPPLGPLVPTPLPNNLNTDISRVPVINGYLNSVGAPVSPFIPPVKENEPSSLLSTLFPKSGIRTGSKLAIQLGSAFLHFMTQVFSSPQSPFAKYVE